jgi:hypothetical protein
MSNFSNITTKELEMFRDRLADEAEKLQVRLLQDLDTLEKKSLELNDILIELEARNEEQSPSSN